jgi:hypothetical protein
MKRFWIVLLLCCYSAAVAQEKSPPPAAKKRGDAAAYGSRDATVLSMMGWGVALSVGIAAFCALVHNESSSSH